MSADRIAKILEIRIREPAAVLRAAAERPRRALIDDTRRLVIIAADHAARATFGAGSDPWAMADRGKLLDRLLLALSRPGVDGVLATADVIEDLLILGALNNKIVIGSMNRGGLAGSVFELDDRITAYDPAGLVAACLDGGKMLLRVDPDDPASVATIESTGRAVSFMAADGLMTILEPFWCHRVRGRVVNDLSPESMIRAIAVASGIGSTSAYTWLKVPVVTDMARVMRTTTLPALLLGGDPADNQSSTFKSWEEALKLPTVRGLAIGRSALFPVDDDVAGAVDRVVELTHRAASDA